MLSLLPSGRSARGGVSGRALGALPGPAVETSPHDHGELVTCRRGKQNCPRGAKAEQACLPRRLLAAVAREIRQDNREVLQAVGQARDGRGGYSVEADDGKYLPCGERDTGLLQAGDICDG